MACLAFPAFFLAAALLLPVYLGVLWQDGAVAFFWLPTVFGGTGPPLPLPKQRKGSRRRDGRRWLRALLASGRVERVWLRGGFPRDPAACGRFYGRLYALGWLWGPGKWDLKPFPSAELRAYVVLRVQAGLFFRRYLGQKGRRRRK